MFPEHGCTVTAPIQLPDLELMVYRIFSESAAFSIIKMSDVDLTNRGNRSSRIRYENSHA